MDMIFKTLLIIIDFVNLDIQQSISKITSRRMGDRG